ncbi:MAG: O-antigen ligase family protein [Phycisphaerae bacterium]
MSNRAWKTRWGATNRAVDLPQLDRLLFFVLAAVLCARPLISESFQRAELSFLPADVPVGTTPATSVWLDSILLATAALVWIRRWRPRPRAGVASLALGLLLAAVVVSVAVANDKRLAANAGAHLFVMALAATALLRVMQARWMVHVLIAALLAGGATNAVKCVSQRANEFGELLQYWEEQKPALAERGVDLNSPALVNYERRLRSGEAFGHLYHPNVTASCLTMCLLVAVGMFVAVLRKPGLDANRRTAAALIAGALALALSTGLWLTGSTGGMAAGILGGLLLLALGIWRDWIVGHGRGAFALVVAIYVGIIAAGTGYGLLKGTLPHASLAFRWQYWQAAARAVADTPLTGIGRENFRAAYLLHKLPDSTEEVGNPHNVWLSLLVELGPLGLIAGVLLIGSAVRAALRGLSGAGRSPPVQAGNGALIAVAVGVLVVQAVFSGVQFSAAGIPLLWATLVAGVWLLAFVAAHSLVLQAGEHPNASLWLAGGVGAALCAALIHNLIGFSLVTPAGLATFVTLAASADALRHQPMARERRNAAAATGRPAGVLLPVGVGLLLIAAYIRVVAAPTIRTQAALHAIEADLRAALDSASADLALRRGLDALALDRWDARTPRRLAQTALQFSARRDAPDELRRSWRDLANTYASVAWQRNRFSFATCRLRAELLLARTAADGDSEALAAAGRGWEVAVGLYPTDPRTRIAAGNVWFRLWKQTNLAEHARRAAEHLETALAIDATRSPEVAVKLRPAELEVIRAQLDELRAGGFGSSVSSAPAPSP